MSSVFVSTFVQAKRLGAVIREAMESHRLADLKAPHDWWVERAVRMIAVEDSSVTEFFGSSLDAKIQEFRDAWRGNRPQDNFGLLQSDYIAVHLIDEMQ